MRLMTNCSWCGYLTILSKGPHVRESERRESSGLYAAAVEVQVLWARLSTGPHVRGAERRALRARLSKGPHVKEPERREGRSGRLSMVSEEGACHDEKGRKGGKW